MNFQETGRGRVDRASFGWRALGTTIALAAVLAGAPNASGQCQVEMAKVLASDGAAGDHFGRHVAIWGDTVVVGAQNWAGLGVAFQGAAYVYSRDEGGANRWGEIARLEASGAPAAIHFGSSVAIWADTIAVGAPRVGGELGSVFVFERDFGGPDNWGQVKELVPSNATPFCSLGESVAIWGDTIVGGAPNEGTSYVGSAYVYERNLGGPDNWGEAAKLIQSDGDIGIGHFAGPGLSIWGDTIVGGAYGAYNGPLESGAAYLFERDFGGPGNWGEVQRLAPGDIADQDFFGSGLSLSGDTLAVSSYSAGGSVYLFERNGTWSQQAKLSGPFSFGNNDGPVALDSDTLLVSAGYSSGTVFVFGRDAGGPNSWGQVDQYLQSDGSPGDWQGFGFVPAVAGDTHVVGAFGDDDNGAGSGSAYIFAPSPLPCPESYCAAGMTSNGCSATIATRGIPSATAPSGFELVASGVEGDRFGLFFFGVSGRATIPWGDPGRGCTSLRCVAAPQIRGTLLMGTGTPGQCDGTFTYDLTEHWTNRPSDNPGLGTTVQAQLWFPDAGNPCNGALPFSTTALSNAIEFVVGP